MYIEIYTVNGESIRLDDDAKSTTSASTNYQKQT